MTRVLRRVHRLEYPFLIHYCCYAVWGACFAAGDITRLWKIPVLLVMLANVGHPMAMSALNSAVDIRSDARNPHKRGIVRAVARFGVRRLTMLAIAEMLLCQGLCVVAAIMVQRPLIAVVMAAIILIHLAYNVEPIRLKRRGLANPVVQGVAFGFLPCVLSHAAVTPVFPPWIWPVYAGLTVSLTARSVWWMVPDRAADTAAGTPTSATRHGGARIARLSCVLALATPVLLAWGLWWGYGPRWALVGVAVSSAWFGGQLVSLRTLAARSYADLRKRLMTPMMLANVAFALIPLIASA